MQDEIKRELISNMTDNLVVLRTKLRLTQVQLANRVGIGRQTLMDIENKKRLMSWNTFVSLLCVFRENEDTRSLLSVFDIYTDELSKFMTTSESESTDQMK